MILTKTEESRLLDSMAMKEYGIPEMVLMENAGASVVRLTEDKVEWDGAFTVVLCGTGNNGGDGFVTARYAAGAGARVLVLLMGNEAHMSESSRMYKSIVEKMGIPVISISRAEEGAPYIHDADILVDALIGTGLSREVTGEKAQLITIMNEAEGIIISVDVPSGMITDTGRAAGVVVDADYTIALGSVKRGHVLYPGSSYSGTLLYSAIGIPDEARMDFPVHLTEQEDIFNILPVRNRISHKGKNGFIGIFAGSDGMEGAALLAGQGALYAGGGKIAVVTSAGASRLLAGKIPELMVSSLGEGSFFTGEDSEKALKRAESYDVVALGPGLGRRKETGCFVRDMVMSWNKTMVIDADGLYALKEENVDLKRCPGRLILTPHVGEFSHLTGLSPKEVEAGRIDEAIRYAVENHVVLVLKGAPTVTAMPDGSAWVNPTGNPGMASGGMGDTLTGIIAALAGQGMNASGAALAGVYLHGLAGDLAAEKTPVGYRASDLAALVPLARAEVMEETGDGMK